MYNHRMVRKRKISESQYYYLLLIPFAVLLFVVFVFGWFVSLVFVFGQLGGVGVGVVSVGWSGCITWCGLVRSGGVVSSGVPLGHSSRSVEGWVRSTSGYWSSGTLFGWGGNGVRQRFEVVWNRGSVVVKSSGDDLVFPLADSGDRLDDGAWHQVVVTYNGSVVVVYVDGVSLGSTQFGGVLDTRASEVVGGDASAVG